MYVPITRAKAAVKAFRALVTKHEISTPILAKVNEVNKGAIESNNEYFKSNLPYTRKPILLTIAITKQKNVIYPYKTVSLLVIISFLVTGLESKNSIVLSLSSFEIIVAPRIAE